MAIIIGHILILRRIIHCLINQIPFMIHRTLNRGLKMLGILRSVLRVWGEGALGGVLEGLLPPSLPKMLPVLLARVSLVLALVDNFVSHAKEVILIINKILGSLSQLKSLSQLTLRTTHQLRRLRVAERKRYRLLHEPWSLQQRRRHTWTNLLPTTATAAPTDLLQLLAHGPTRNRSISLIAIFFMSK